MNNLQTYLLSIEKEAVLMHFFSSGCECCPAKEFCCEMPTKTCYRENFMAWAEEEGATCL